MQYRAVQFTDGTYCPDACVEVARKAARESGGGNLGYIQKVGRGGQVYK